MFPFISDRTAFFLAVCCYVGFVVIGAVGLSGAGFLLYLLARGIAALAGH